MAGDQVPGQLALTFNNLPVCLPNQDGNIEQVIDYRQGTDVMQPPPHMLATWERIDFEPAFPSAVDLSIANYPSLPSVGINKLYWPCVGAGRFAFGLFLMTLEDWTAAKAEDPTAFTMRLTAGDASFAQVMYPMKPRPLTQEWEKVLSLDTGGNNIHPNTLLIVPVVDERFLWQVLPFEADRDSLNTWPKLLNAIKPYIETHQSLTVDPLATGTLVTGTNKASLFPDRLNLAGWNSVAAVLDALCATLGYRYYKDLLGHGIAAPDEESSLCSDLVNSEHLLGGGLVEIRKPDKFLFRYHEDQDPRVFTYNLPTAGELANDPEWRVGINSSLQTTDRTAAERFFRQTGALLDGWYDCSFDVLLEGVQAFDTEGYVDALFLELGSLKHGAPALQTRAYTMDPMTFNLQNLVEHRDSSSSSCVFEDLTLWICCNVGLNETQSDEMPEEMNFVAATESEAAHFQWICCKEDPIEPTAEVCQEIKVYEDQITIQQLDGTSDNIATFPFDASLFCQPYCAELDDYNVRIGSRKDACNCNFCTFPSLDLWSCCGPGEPAKQMDYHDGGPNGPELGLDYFSSPCSYTDVETGYEYNYEIRVYRDRIEYHGLGINAVANDWRIFCIPDTCVSEVTILPESMAFIPAASVGNNEYICNCASSSECLFSELELWLCCDITLDSGDEGGPGTSYKMTYFQGDRPGNDYFEARCPKTSEESRHQRVIRVYRDRVVVNYGDREWVLDGEDFEWELWCEPDFCYEFSFAGNPYFGIGNTPTVCGCDSACEFGDFDLWICCGVNQPYFQMEKRVEDEITVYVGDCGDFKITVYEDRIEKYYDEGPKVTDNDFNWQAWCDVTDFCLETLGVYIGNSPTACDECASESVSEPCEDLGIRWENIPVVSAADARYVLGLDDNECLVRIPLASCDTGTVGGSDPIISSFTVTEGGTPGYQSGTANFEYDESTDVMQFWWTEDGTQNEVHAILERYNSSDVLQATAEGSTTINTPADTPRTDSTEDSTDFNAGWTPNGTSRNYDMEIDVSGVSTSTGDYFVLKVVGSTDGDLSSAGTMVSFTVPYGGTGAIPL